MNNIISDAFISVILPVYNGERYLREALESILSQTHSHLELIIIDDGSRDATPEIINDLKRRDARIKAFRHNDNKGIVAARNAGFDHLSPGSIYVAIMDADDISYPQRLASQAAFLDNNPGYGLVGGQTRIIDENGRAYGLRKYPLTDEAIRKVFCREDPFAQPTVMLRREALDKCGKYAPRYRTAEDYDLWFRIADHFKVANLDEVLLDYRVGTAQSKKTMLKEALRNTIDIQKKRLFDRRYFSAFNLLHFIAEHVLLITPDGLILWLFKKLKYNK